MTMKMSIKYINLFVLVEINHNLKIINIEKLKLISRMKDTFLLKRNHNKFNMFMLNL